MNLHNLAAWAGHDVQTLQRYYAHVIARYQGGEPIDLERECSEARAAVAAEPFKPPTKMRRGRSRRRGEREPPERRAAAQGSRRGRADARARRAGEAAGSLISQSCKSA
jgi:hypothetical protein